MVKDMPTSEIAVRRLEASDAELYRAIRLESLRLNPEAYGSALETEEARPLSAFVERLTETHLLGGFADDELLGIAGFLAEEGPKSRHKGHLWGVYVRPSARGKGVARRLCEGVIEFARGKVEILQLTVTATNEQARRLYSDLGFVEFGLEKRARKVDDRYFDDILMAMDLENNRGP
jgi:ribosomal protein S18 acetylase RimI-like enzyme